MENYDYSELEEDLQDHFNQDISIVELEDLATQYDLLVPDIDILKRTDVETIIKGIDVELEHTSDIGVALIIVLHHLDEYDDYYIRLDEAGL